ncbi:MAG: hypothetical protein AAGA48_09120 [Myxococcota bacterium]
MDWRVAAAGSGLLGLILGGVGGQFLGEPEDDSASEDCEEQLVQLRSEAEQLQVQLEIVGGLPTPWPEEDMGPFEADAVKAWLDAAPSRFDAFASVAMLDCEEFPCLLVLNYLPDVPGGAETLEPVHDALDAHTEGRIGMESLVSDGPSGTTAAVPVAPDDALADPAIHARIDVRFEELLKGSPAEPVDDP